MRLRTPARAAGLPVRADPAYRRTRLALLAAMQLVVPLWLAAFVALDARRACSHWGETGGEWDQCRSDRADELGPDWLGDVAATPLVVVAVGCVVAIALLPGLCRWCRLAVVAGAFGTFVMSIALIGAADWVLLAEGGTSISLVPSAVAFALWSTRWLAIATTLRTRGAAAAWSSLLATTTTISLVSLALPSNMALLWLLPVALATRLATRLGAANRGLPDRGRHLFAGTYPAVCVVMLSLVGGVLPLLVG